MILRSWRCGGLREEQATWEWGWVHCPPPPARPPARRPSARPSARRWVVRSMQTALVLHFGDPDGESNRDVLALLRAADRRLPHLRRLDVLDFHDTPLQRELLAYVAALLEPSLIDLYVQCQQPVAVPQASGLALLDCRCCLLPGAAGLPVLPAAEAPAPP